MDKRRRRQCAGILVVMLAALAGCNGTTPPTGVVCEGCVAGIEQTAADQNYSVSVGESVTNIYVYSNGSAAAEARIELTGDGVDELRANGSFVDGIVTAGDEQPRETRSAFDRSDLDVQFDGSTAVVTYRIPEFGERRLGGTVFSDRFFRGDGEGPSTDAYFDEDVEIATDRLAVHSPERMRPVVTPPDTERNDGAVVFDDRTVPDRTYLVFGPAGPDGKLLGRIVVALDVFNWAGSAAATIAALPTVLLGGLSVALWRGYVGSAAENWRPSRDRTLWTLSGFLGVVAVWVTVGIFFGGTVIPATAAAGTLAAFAGLWLSVGRPMDSADETDRLDERTDDASRDRGPKTEGIGAAEQNGVPVTARVDGVGSSQDGDFADPVWMGRRWPFPRPRRTVGGILTTLGVAAATIGLVAADWTGRTALWASGAAALLPFLAMPVLGYGVAVSERFEFRATALTATALSPAVLGFSWLVHAGARSVVPSVGTFAWAVVATLVCPLLFYVTLWVTKR